MIQREIGSTSVPWVSAVRSRLGLQIQDVVDACDVGMDEFTLSAKPLAFSSCVVRRLDCSSMAARVEIVRLRLFAEAEKVSQS